MNFYFKFLWGRCSILWQSPLNITVLGRACARRGKVELRLNTSLFHHLARLFTSSIQLGYIPTTWKLATLRMLLKPDKPITLTTSYRPISLISSIVKLFQRVIEQRLRFHQEHIGFINKHQSGF